MTYAFHCSNAVVPATARPFVRVKCRFLISSYNVPPQSLTEHGQSVHMDFGGVFWPEVSFFC